MSLAFQRLSLRVAQLSLQTLEMSMAAGVTIAARAPLLYSGARTASDAAEAQRMVFEKVEATIESNVAASMAMMTLWTRMAVGGVRGPTALAHGLADVASAAALPVRKRVRANARRLVRR
ncbi:hypothetical protein [uncultured Alsobacter sp.]|uniref:hypothetical protein n=1 Tax=uncultured Alsobacter sp. TaxID=1748258 RepID=UPI0025FABEA1|nr:hypothetical protein [uncultured Alsobacter sp.]